MNLLELHIIRSYPLSRLNRDENGSPKTFNFGGKTRAAISSQCIKRTVRMYMKEKYPETFGGIRTKFIVEHLIDSLTKKGVVLPTASKIAEAIGAYFSKLDPKSPVQKKTITNLFVSEGEIDTLCEYLAGVYKEGNLDEIFEEVKKDTDDDEDGKKKKKGKKDTKSNDTKLSLRKKSIMKDINPTDMGDIAIFGRMVANDNSLSVEAATSFSFPFSVHSCINEPDFFAAVEESPFTDDPGAAHIGESEFNSACYYNYVSINLDIFNKGILNIISEEDRKRILSTFIEACIIATPTASKHGMFAATQPSTVIGLVRDRSFELSLANAFEQALRPSFSGYTKEASRKLEEEWEKHVSTYGKRLGLVCKSTLNLGDSLDDFLEGLVENAY